MSAYILVMKHPYYSSTDKNGKFMLTDVPPGTYKLHMWHEGIAVISKELENGKVKNYHFEEPYIVAKEIVVPVNGEIVVDFDLVTR